MPSPTRRSSSPNTRHIQKNLLELGIDIDGDLINRLQNNLNISKTFDSVNRAVKLLQSDKVKRKNKTTLNKEITLRVKSNTNKYAASQPIVEDISFDFLSSKVTKGLEATAMEILETLGDYTDHTISANTKSICLKSIELLHIKFVPDPITFLKNFFGIHRNSSKKEIQVIFTANRFVTLNFLQSGALSIIPNLNPAYIPELYKVLQLKQAPIEKNTNNFADIWLLCTIMKKYSTRLFNHKLYVASNFWLNKDSNTNHVQFSNESDNPMIATRSSKGMLTRRLSNVNVAGDEDNISADLPPYIKFWNKEDIRAKIAPKLGGSSSVLGDHNSSTAECLNMFKYKEPKVRCTAGFFDRQQKIDNTLPTAIEPGARMPPKEVVPVQTTIYMENQDHNRPGNKPNPVFTFVSNLLERPKGTKRCMGITHSMDNSNRGTTKICLNWEGGHQHEKDNNVSNQEPKESLKISAGTIRRCEARNNCKMNLILTGEEKHLKGKVNNRRYCPPHTEDTHYKDTLQ